MNAKHTTAPAVEKTKLTPRQVVGIKLEAILTGAGALALAIGAIVLASEIREPRLLALWGVAVFLGVRANLLWREVHDGPSLALRLWWRFIAWRTARAMRQKVQPAPYRPVRVAGQEEAVRIPRQPGEMARETEPVVIAGLTASDVYWIVCRAASIGLDERSWKLSTETVVLPSGRQLSRNGFRAVQAWLVERGLADKYPRYHMVVTPEHVVEVLK